MKIYISGKISGTDLTETRKRFASVAKAMKRLGYEPVNPLENGLSEHAYRALQRYRNRNTYNV